MGYMEIYRLYGATWFICKYIWVIWKYMVYMEIEKDGPYGLYGNVQAIWKYMGYVEICGLYGTICCMFGGKTGLLFDLAETGCAQLGTDSTDPNVHAPDLQFFRDKIKSKPGYRNTRMQKLSPEIPETLFKISNNRHKSAKIGKNTLNLMSRPRP